MSIIRTLILLYVIFSLEVVEGTDDVPLGRVDETPTERSSITLSEAEDMYQKGLRLLVECRNPSLGDPAALRLIATAAESGHVKAREVIVTASALAWGGLPLSVEKAVEGFRHLAEEGNPRGQLGLGIMYAAGVGVNASIPRALVYQTFAALGGDELAEMAMGYRYLVGAGVEPNCETALAYYRRVAATVAEQVENRIKEGAGPTLTGPTVVRINLLEEREQALGGGGGAALSNYFISDDILSYYKFVADSNNVSAQVTLGQLYYNGQHGIDLDHKLALHYFKRAADSGSHLAMAYLGEMYLVGSPDVPKDESLALNYLQRAVIAGNPLALTSLGLAYLHGRAGLTPDPVKAMDLFVKAADQGWAEAQLQLGLLFMGTVGRTSDYKMALKYFTLASQQGNTLAFYNLGQMHATGMGVFRSCSTATELFKNVAERGRWSQLLTSAYLEYWSGNRGAAFLQYLALAELGYEVAQSNVALMLEDGDVDFIPKTERYERALVYWKRSAGQGSSSSRVKLGDYYFYGLGTEVNYEQAIQEYRIATDVLRNAQAMFNLGYMHEQGLGFKRDLYLAKRFYDMAAETSSDAQIPAALALVKLSFHFALDFLRKAPIIRWIADLFSSSSDGATARNSEVTMQMDWDFYIIPLLAGLLAILIVYIRLQR
uniref:Ovule protein n=2 Tax=Mesocestoides corti TaxID=53468 RepID=A0A5K3F4I8_MESCO